MADSEENGAINSNQAEPKVQSTAVIENADVEFQVEEKLLKEN